MDYFLTLTTLPPIVTSLLSPPETQKAKTATLPLTLRGKLTTAQVSAVVANVNRAWQAWRIFDDTANAATAANLRLICVISANSTATSATIHFSFDSGLFFATFATIVNIAGENFD